MNEHRNLLLPAVLALLTGCSESKSTTSTDGSAGAPTSPSCEAERDDLERTMAKTLDEAVTDEPSFTLALETADGHRFVHSRGESSLGTSYESASTSKWVAASVILDVVDQGALALTDEPSAYLTFWKKQSVTLAQLLAFTSGFSQEPPCLNLPRADFADCVERAYDLNVDRAPDPNSEFDYSGVHLQIAGLMALRAARVDSFSTLFGAWQAKTGLFPSAAFDLPSAKNPRLAGGMHWTGEEYLGFLRALYRGELLEAATRQAMLTSQRGEAKVTGSPPLDGLGQDWAYGFGNWIECPTALGADTFDCASGGRNSSPGAYGAYPFIDFEQRYFGILARRGDLGSFRDGNALFSVVAGDAARWATACNP